MSKKGDIITEDQAFSKMARICSRKEYSPFDILQKLFKMGFTDDQSDKIIERLKNKNFINEVRFVRGYIDDKLRLNGWGVKKIELHLRQKQLPQNLIEKVFSEYSGAELNRSLENILTKKWKYIKGDSDYEKKGKLIRYALGKGFELSEIVTCVEKLKLKDREIE